jgi:hypothetical protein
MSISRETCYEALQEAAYELGHAPTFEEYKALNLSPSYNTIISRCGSWNAALEHLDADKPTRRRYSDEDCLEALREAAEVLSEEPTWYQYAELDISPARTTIEKRFESWIDAKKEAGVRSTAQMAQR